VPRDALDALSGRDCAGVEASVAADLLRSLTIASGITRKMKVMFPSGSF
jgi:hypothetical protein